MRAGAGDAFQVGGRLHREEQLHRFQVVNSGHLSVVPVTDNDNSPAGAYILIYISQYS